jgi:hypothetical protein
MLDLRLGAWIFVDQRFCGKNLRETVWGSGRIRKKWAKKAHFYFYIACCPDGVNGCTDTRALRKIHILPWLSGKGYSLSRRDIQGVNFHSLELPSGPGLVPIQTRLSESQFYAFSNRFQHVFLPFYQFKLFIYSNLHFKYLINISDITEDVKLSARGRQLIS